MAGKEIGNLPIIDNSSNEIVGPVLDSQTTSLENVLRLLIKDKYTKDTLSGVTGFQGVVLRAITDPRLLEYSNRTEATSITNKTLIKYKVWVMGPIFSIFRQPKDFNDYMAIEALPDFSTSREIGDRQLAPGELVWVTFGNNNNFKDPVIQYSYTDGPTGTVSQGAIPNPAASPSGNFPINNPKILNKLEIVRDEKGNIRNPPLAPISFPDTPNANRTEEYPDNALDGPWTVPLRGDFRISSLVGDRPNPGNPSVVQKNHTGIDIAAPLHTPLYAMASGKITTIRPNYNNPGGISVFLEFKDSGVRYIACYLHLNQYTVKLNQLVNKGDVIGLVGSTGGSTGPHLHLTMYVPPNSTSWGPFVNPYSIKKIKDIFPPEAMGPAKFIYIKQETQSTPPVSTAPTTTDNFTSATQSTANS